MWNLNPEVTRLVRGEVNLSSGKPAFRLPPIAQQALRNLQPSTLNGEKNRHGDVQDDRRKRS